MTNTNWAMKLKRYQRPCSILYFLETSQIKSTTYTLHFFALTQRFYWFTPVYPILMQTIKKYTAFQKIYTTIHRHLKALESLKNNLIMLGLWKKETVLVLKYSIKKNQNLSEIRNLTKSVPHVTKFSDKIKATASNSLIWNFVNNTWNLW